MRIGIVGHAADKFTAETEAKARSIIQMIIDKERINQLSFVDPPGIVVVSGGCHLGGIDIWAEEVADELGVPKDIKRPTRLTWSGPGGFKERNLEAMLCEIVGSLMGLNVPLPATVATWWIEHEAKDRDRIKAMRAQKDHAKARLRRQIEEAQAELKALEG
jgi:cell division ATPase FtsA